MTAENPQPNPIAGNVVPDGTELFDRLRSVPGVHIESILPSTPVILDLDQTSVIDDKFNRYHQAAHTLRAMLDAGGEVFGVVQVSHRDKGNPDFVDDGVLITRFAKEADEDSNKRAEVVGILKPKESLTVGRQDLFNRDFEDIDDRMSRTHFSVALSENGKLAITDENSTNGTKILTNVGGRKNAVTISKAMGGFKVWSVDSETAVQAFKLQKQ